jgi:signal transduction histidine kinase
MFGLRAKLSFGFGGLLLVILVIGIQGILRVNELGQSIDVILRENYRSVVACQDMKENLERVNSGILSVLLGYEQEGRAQINKHLAALEKAMDVERANITLPGEGDVFRSLESHASQYREALGEVVNASSPLDERQGKYFTVLLPLFQSIKQSADEILLMNQRSMSDASTVGRQRAAQVSQRMYLLLICGILIATAFIYLTGRWILRPLTALTASANEIAGGNLDLVVGANSRDEIGQLSRSFDAMASSLREYRRTNEAKMLSMQKATQQALESLSAAIAVVDRDGAVEVVTKTARETLGLEIGCRLEDGKYPWMEMLAQKALDSRRREHLDQEDRLIQVFVEGEEKFYQPEAIPILDGLGFPVGITLILHDATRLRQQDELKRGLVSTVSHQLKTPLTSIRMALYLLLDDKLGPLTPKQEELLLAARDDTERLHSIVEDLLDIARIQSGRIQMDFQTLDASTLAQDAVESFKVPAQDRGITLVASIPQGLPQVMADPTRIPHVFANLLSNAIKYTSPGGTVTVGASTDQESVWYTVSDTGPGIPSEYLPHVFEQFFRVPDQGGSSGAGLGLAIAKEVVVAHGGEIRVESQPGKGSIFSFSLRKAEGSFDREEAL